MSNTTQTITLKFVDAQESIWFHDEVDTYGLFEEGEAYEIDDLTTKYIVESSGVDEFLQVAKLYNATAI